jgi:hypothetical protein
VVIEQCVFKPDLRERRGGGMPLDALDQKTLDSLPRLSEVYDAYGVQVNALSVSEIFALYERAGFLYPEKAARLLPHLKEVRENWRRMMHGGDSLLYVLTAGDRKSGLASIAVWRTTQFGWTSQHLVSENNPVASRAVMLAGTAASILKGVDESHQNWFRPENRFPSRVFGSMVQTIGQSHASVQRHMYFALPRNSPLPSGGSVRIVPYDPSYEEALCLIASVARGGIYVAAEQLAADPELTAVDQLYREVGLKRTRQVWLAFKGNKEEPVGAAIAYRGPLGLNFSYIENRCDLLLHPTLPESDVVDVVAPLLRAAVSAYEDFELDTIPVIAEEIAAPALLKVGAEFLRHYCQGTWLQEGQLRFYRHVDGFYARLLARMEKHAMQPSLVGQER